MEFDYRNYNPLSNPDAVWGKGQAGFNISRNGRIYLSDNRPKLIDMVWHPQTYFSDLIDGEGIDKTVYSGIYSWEREVALWLFPELERDLTKDMKRGLAKLIGVHKITKQTPVKSNTERGVLFLLGDV